jgi:hypothetical protein
MVGISPPEPACNFSCEDRDRILKHLNELLGCEAFAGSRRSQAFLRYVVEEALAGRGLEIKERNIAIDVFSRGSDFDPQCDSIVRVCATEVRKRLAWAYEAGVGHNLRIELPVGNYHPVFHFEETGTPPNSLPGMRSKPIAAHLKRRPVPIIGLMAIGIIVFLVAAILHPQISSLRASPLDALWRPFCQQRLPVLIALPAPTVLTLRHPEKESLLQFQPEIPQSELRWRTNYFVGTGAALGAARFAEQLAMRRQAFYIKFGSNATFSDLKHSAAILLGAYSSPLTLEIVQRLRFRFESDDKQHCIIDSLQASQHWCIPRQEAAEAAEGYALVSRLLNSDSGHPILVVAGIGARDTQAAVEFLSSSNYFDSFAHSVPRDWPRRNFEVILHNSVHGDVPGAPAIVSSCLW